MSRDSTFLWCVACDQRPHIRHHEEDGFIAACDCTESLVPEINQSVMEALAPETWEYGTYGKVRVPEDSDG